MSLFSDEPHAKEISNEQIEEVTLSTGNVNVKYVVRDVLFIAERHQVDLFDEQLDLNELFSSLKFKLKKKAVSYGADAVINCRFEHKTSLVDGLPYAELFAYGTVVQFTQTTIG
ncbi:hypothetical protein BAU15_04850 [Enterococcus sp. JM4C]|uniref:heavy metal-binding domain-containing protein n=1 Tax=Candidatus Enterococcus huntleyi TaxID=1857217 RepID=UPI00137B04C2|nr:heavy metal-binding domain-containing protein [Enterococcus sp. JM4C]KAF1295087.1 hypothetical protein BAU15_04850 [Enterococcus sp. JM4C]